MEKTEIKLGNVTYQLRRVFVGEKTATDLLIDAVANRAREEIAAYAIEKTTV